MLPGKYLRTPYAVTTSVWCTHYFDLGGLALVPVGDTGTILFSMRTEEHDFSGAICDLRRALVTEIDGCTSTVLT
jgi:hypothetical protein